MLSFDFSIFKFSYMNAATKQCPRRRPLVHSRAIGPLSIDSFNGPRETPGISDI